MNSSLFSPVVRVAVSCFLFSIFSFQAIATTYVVTSNADAGVGTLREAIALANANPGKDTITFNISGGGSVQTINIDSELIITDDVFVDGYSQFSSSLTPPVVITNSPAPGILINGGTIGSKIIGVILNDIAGPAMILNSSNNIIQGCFIGTNADGTSRVNNLASGILIQGTATNNIIGGTAKADRNVIVPGNNSNGIAIMGGTYNYVLGNFIGTDRTGKLRLAQGTGIQLSNAQSVRIGGGKDSLNVLGGNNRAIQVINECSNVEIYGNLIGIGIDSLSNVFNIQGIEVTNSNNIYIGSLFGNRGNLIFYSDNLGINLYTDCNNVSIQKNVISGNKQQAIFAQNNINQLIIQGNYLGTDISGTIIIPNLSTNIDLNNIDNALIGGINSGEGNIISGTSGGGSHGIILQGSPYSKNCVIKGNFIGVNVNGEKFSSHPLTGSNAGIGIVAKGDGHIIGDTVDGAGNIISGNGSWGILITDANNNIIRGNKIGVNVNDQDAGNRVGGIVVRSENRNLFTCKNTVIENNFIAYNGKGFPLYQTLSPMGSQHVAHGEGPGIALSIDDWDNNRENDRTIYTLIRYNSIYCNAGKGIHLNNGKGNQNKIAPAIDVTLSNSQKIVGITDPQLANDTIDIYLMDNECSTCEVNPQGKTYVGSIVAGNDGSWEYDYGATIPGKLVATATDANGNTSEFSKCYNPCYLKAVMSPLEVNKIQLTQGVTGIVNLNSANSTSISGIDSLRYFVSNSKGINWYEYADKDTSITFSYPGRFETGTYEISLVVYSGGCRDTSTISFNVEYFFIPNLLTPNNDRLNDKFFISDNPERFNLSIFNRFGSQIYKKEGYMDEWDLNEVNDGMYFYHIIDTKEDNKSYKGWIHVLSNQL